MLSGYRKRCKSLKVMHADYDNNEWTVSCMDGRLGRVMLTLHLGILKLLAQTGLL